MCFAYRDFNNLKQTSGLLKEKSSAKQLAELFLLRKCYDGVDLDAFYWDLHRGVQR